MAVDERIAHEDPGVGEDAVVLGEVEVAGVGADAGAVAVDAEEAGVEIAGEAAGQRAQAIDVGLEHGLAIEGGVEVFAQAGVVGLERAQAGLGVGGGLGGHGLGHGLVGGRGCGRAQDHDDGEVVRVQGAEVSVRKASGISSPVNAFRNSTRSVFSALDRLSGTISGSFMPVKPLSSPPRS